ncbi:hypothetical protein M885DRAFT_177116 [Pelagophyceae sp. CCMP2097]|nr:hypothetical protein M885DRAFT_177116 [Pelagophyceae sp. CCMP2097]
MLDEFLSEDPDEAEEDADADARAAAPAPAPVDAAASDVDEPPAAPSAPAAAAAPIGAAAATDAGDELFEDEVLDDPEVLDDEVLDDDATATGDDAASPPVPPDEGPAVAEEPAAQEPEPQQLWVGFRLRGVVLTEKRSGLLGGFKSSKASDAYFLEETSVNYKSETKPELRLCNGPDAAEDAPPERGADFTVALDATGLETLTMKLSAHPDGHNPVVVGEAVISVMELLKVGGASALFEGHVAGAWLEALVLGGPPRISKIAAAVTHAGAPFVGQAYALWSDLAAPQLAFECVVEPMGVHDLVAAAITPVADAMLEASACWLARSERARADAAAFDDDEEAQRYGARRVRIAILGARGLTRLDASGNVPKRSFSAVGSAVGSSWRTMRGLAQRLRDGEVPRLGMDDGGDSSCPSPFASAALHSPRRAFAVPLGRTNTEYATESPSWGANARAAGFCAHAKPSTEFMANAPTSRLIGPESASTCPLLEFYVRRDEAAASFILVDVMDERYSVAEGIAAVKLGTVRLPLPPFEAAASKMSTPQWVPVKLVQPGDAEGLQCALFVALHVSSLEAPGDEAGADAAFDDEMQRRSVNAARDVSKLHSWLEVAHIKVDPVAAKLVAADGSARQIAETARDGVGGFEQAETSTCNFEKAEGHDPKQDVDLQLHDIGWLRAHAKALARDGMRLRKFVDEANSASEANKSGFKPSKDKANLDVAATPTNLHVHLFEATRRAGAAAGPEDWDLWCGVTSGAPTVAATLGAQRGGVRKRRPSSGSSSESGLSSETAGHRPRLPV